MQILQRRRGPRNAKLLFVYNSISFQNGSGQFLTFILIHLPNVIKLL